MAEIDAVLTTVKEGLGIQDTDTSFDGTLIVHINSIFMNLNQLGIGPDSPVFQLDASGLGDWSTFLTAGDDATYSLAKTYMILSVQLLFDPPASSVVMTALKNQIERLEVRLENQVVEKTTI